MSRTAPWPDRVPSTLTLTPYGTYALNGRLEVLVGGGASDEFRLRQV